MGTEGSSGWRKSHRTRLFAKEAFTCPTPFSLDPELRMAASETIVPTNDPEIFRRPLPISTNNGVSALASVIEDSLSAATY